MHDLQQSLLVSRTITYKVTGLRHCDLNDLGQAVERPSNRSGIIVVSTVLVKSRGRDRRKLPGRNTSDRQAFVEHACVRACPELRAGI